MFYDVTFLWLWLALTLIVGAAIGWLTEGEGEPTVWFRGWFRIAVVVFVIALLAAILHLIPGRAGLWVETAVLFAAAYAIGALVGGALNRLRAAA